MPLPEKGVVPGNNAGSAEDLLGKGQPVAAAHGAGVKPLVIDFSGMDAASIEQADQAQALVGWINRFQNSGLFRDPLLLPKLSLSSVLSVAHLVARSSKYLEDKYKAGDPIETFWKEFVRGKERCAFTDDLSSAFDALDQDPSQDLPIETKAEKMRDALLKQLAEFGLTDTASQMQVLAAVRQNAGAFQFSFVEVFDCLAKSLGVEASMPGQLPDEQLPLSLRKDEEGEGNKIIFTFNAVHSGFREVNGDPEKYTLFSAVATLSFDVESLASAMSLKVTISDPDLISKAKSMFQADASSKKNADDSYATSVSDDFLGEVRARNAEINTLKSSIMQEFEAWAKTGVPEAFDFNQLFLDKTQETLDRFENYHLSVDKFRNILQNDIQILMRDLFNTRIARQNTPSSIDQAFNNGLEYVSREFKRIQSEGFFDQDREFAPYEVLEELLGAPLVLSFADVSEVNSKGLIQRIHALKADTSENAVEGLTLKPGVSDSSWPIFSAINSFSGENFNRLALGLERPEVIAALWYEMTGRGGGYEAVFGIEEATQEAFEAKLTTDFGADTDYKKHVVLATISQQSGQMLNTGAIHHNAKEIAQNVFAPLCIDTMVTGAAMPSASYNAENRRLTLSYVANIQSLDPVSPGRLGEVACEVVIDMSEEHPVPQVTKLDVTVTDPSLIPQVRSSLLNSNGLVSGTPKRNCVFEFDQQKMGQYIEQQENSSEALSRAKSNVERTLESWVRLGESVDFDLGECIKAEAVRMSNASSYNEVDAEKLLSETIGAVNEAWVNLKRQVIDVASKLSGVGSPLKSLVLFNKLPVQDQFSELKSYFEFQRNEFYPSASDLTKINRRHKKTLGKVKGEVGALYFRVTAAAIGKAAAPAIAGIADESTKAYKTAHMVNVLVDRELADMSAKGWTFTDAERESLVAFTLSKLGVALQPGETYQAKGMLKRSGPKVKQEVSQRMAQLNTEISGYLVKREADPKPSRERRRRIKVAKELKAFIDKFQELEEKGVLQERDYHAAMSAVEQYSKELNNAPFWHRLGFGSRKANKNLLGKALRATTRNPVEGLNKDASFSIDATDAFDSLAARKGALKDAMGGRLNYSSVERFRNAVEKEDIIGPAIDKALNSDDIATVQAGLIGSIKAIDVSSSLTDAQKSYAVKVVSKEVELIFKYVQARKENLNNFKKADSVFAGYGVKDVASFKTIAKVKALENTTEDTPKWITDGKVAEICTAFVEVEIAKPAVPAVPVADVSPEGVVAVVKVEASQQDRAPSPTTSEVPGSPGRRLSNSEIGDDGTADVDPHAPVLRERDAANHEAKRRDANSAFAIAQGGGSALVAKLSQGRKKLTFESNKSLATNGW